MSKKNIKIEKTDIPEKDRAYSYRNTGGRRTNHSS